VNVGFDEAKRHLITALREGSNGHEMRDSADTKNLLKMGEIDALDLCEIAVRSGGQGHEVSPHHWRENVHVLRCEGWHIKFFFVDSLAVFISVHR